MTRVLPVETCVAMERDVRSAGYQSFALFIDTDEARVLPKKSLGEIFSSIQSDRIKSGRLLYHSTPAGRSGWNRRIPLMSSGIERLSPVILFNI